MYRIYIRSQDQRVSQKTVTGDPVAAKVAFESLVGQQQLDGKTLMAVITKNGSPIAHHKFNAQPSDCLYFWRGRTCELRL